MIWLLAAELAAHAEVVVRRRRAAGQPTCADDVGDDRKLSALGEEFGEVCRAMQDGTNLRGELLDVATAAILWAASLPEVV